MEDILHLFFSRKYENAISKKMMYYDYDFPYEDVEAYIHQLLETDEKEYLDYILGSQDEIDISPKDICQFSNFDDCSINLCRKLIDQNNLGVSCLEAGKILLDDGKDRTKLAFTKYGENHCKTGEMLGLIYCLGSTYYVSSLGMVYINLDSEQRKQLLSRLVLRTNLCRRVIKASQNGPVHMRQFLYMISDSTYVRRRSNVKALLKMVNIQKNGTLEIDFE